MINEKILDEIYPVPDLDKLKEEKVQELQKDGFVITNFNSGGIFNTILMIVLHIRIEFIKLLRTILGQMFLQSADGIWLQLRAEDYSKKIKVATKTQGNVSLTRSKEAVADTITIPAGSVFKTQKDINGEELRFFTSKDVVMLPDTLQADIPVEAENTGVRYNVPQGQITKSLLYFDGIGNITNVKEWVTKEGSDIEDNESLRTRALHSWAELSSRPIALKYKNVCEAVIGVLYVRVDDMHPRGQGTVDIIVTSTKGDATEALLNDVMAAANDIKGETDDILVKSATTVMQDISIVITIPRLASDDGIGEKATAVIESYFKISKDRNLNELIQVDLLYALKDNINIIKNVKILNPDDDLVLEKDKVIIVGEIDVEVIREE